MTFAVAGQCLFLHVVLVMIPTSAIQALHFESDASFEDSVTKTIPAHAAQKALMRGEGAFVEAGRPGKGQVATTTTTTINPTAPISMEFGGDKHGDNDQGKDKFYLVRPEAVKSKACKGARCWDCRQPTNCFHGETSEGWNWLVLNAAADLKFTHYEAEVWARCPSVGNSKAAWWLEVGDVTNGRLELYAGNTPAKFDKKGTWAEFPITGEDKARIRVLFFPSNPAIKSHAKVWLEAAKVDSNVDKCMAVKDCLDLLGDGSDAAFELRNGNGLQLQCLTGMLSAMSILVQELCRKWKTCVIKTGKKKLLLALLRAGRKKDPLLLEGVSLSNETRLDANTCVEPSIDDPESWDCECAEDMIKSCEGQELEPCIHTLMCKNSNVCCSWKKDHCPSPITCTGALMAERSQVSTKAVTGSSLHNGLDGATQGKCAEQ